MAVDIRNDELVKQLSAPTRFAMPRLYESPQATSLPPPPQGWKQSHPPGNAFSCYVRRNEVVFMQRFQRSNLTPRTFQLDPHC